MRTDVDLIKEAIDWDVVLAHFNAKHIKKSYQEIRCCCFLHGGDNPDAFVVTLKNDLWYCHTGQCGGGDIFDLFARSEGWNLKNRFQDVKDIIANVLHIDLSGAAPVSAETFINSEARKWLARQREAARPPLTAYDITPHGPFEELASLKWYSEDTLKAYDITYSPTEKRLVCPIRMDGMIVGVTMRRVTNDPATPKWIHKPFGLHDSLYSFDVALDAIKEASAAILVEGVMDALSMYEAGYRNVLATLGTHITQDQMQRLMKYATRLTLAYDNDKAGVKFVKELLSTEKEFVEKRKWWHRVETMFCVDVFQLPAGKDPGDLRPSEIRDCLIITPGEWLKGVT